MLRNALHSKTEALVTPIIHFLNEKGISPNQLTLAGLALNLLAGWIYANGWIFLGCFVLLLAGWLDMLDGSLARISGRTSPFGMFLDSTVDRYSDFFIFSGLAFHFAQEGEGGWFLVVMGIILGSFVTSYAKARAENLIKHCDTGIFERAERIVILALGSLIPILLPLALVILLVGTNISALQRIFYTRKALTKTSE